MKYPILACLMTLLVFVYSSCNDKKSNLDNQGRENISELNPSDFDTIIDGKAVGLYWLKNKAMHMAMTSYGGRIVGLWVPDNQGNLTDVVIGMGSTEGYKKSTEPYFGATIGRVGNRIARGKFKLEGKEYQIPVNNGKNALHGGPNGFHDVVWDVNQKDERTVVLSYTSADMEEGFPGTLKVKVIYSLSESNSLRIEYEATTDKPTLVNLTNHAFFNLNGEGSGSILNHKLQINAAAYTPVDDGLIPTGVKAQVEHTPFDFRELHTIGERINQQTPQLLYGGGYDHNFILNADISDHAARVIGDKSGIIMDIFTEEPGLQFYSGNFMEGKNLLKNGARDDYRTAFCLETQHFPDAPNHSDFPSIILRPGETYSTVSEYRFSL